MPLPQNIQEIPNLIGEIEKSLPSPYSSKESSSAAPALPTNPLRDLLVRECLNLRIAFDKFSRKNSQIQNNSPEHTAALALFNRVTSLLNAQQYYKEKRFNTYYYALFIYAIKSNFFPLAIHCLPPKRDSVDVKGIIEPISSITPIRLTIDLGRVDILRKILEEQKQPYCLFSSSHPDTHPISFILKSRCEPQIQAEMLTLLLDHYTGRNDSAETKRAIPAAFHKAVKVNNTAMIEVFLNHFIARQDASLMINAIKAAAKEGHVDSLSVLLETYPAVPDPNHPTNRLTAARIALFEIIGSETAEAATQTLAFIATHYPAALTATNDEKQTLVDILVEKADNNTLCNFIHWTITADPPQLACLHDFLTAAQEKFLSLTQQATQAREQNKKALQEKAELFWRAPGYALLSAVEENNTAVLQHILTHHHEAAMSILNSPVPGRTALHRAAALGSLESVRILVNVAPQLATITDFQGNTASALAKENGHMDVVDILTPPNPSPPKAEASYRTRNITDPTQIALAKLANSFSTIRLEPDLSESSSSTSGIPLDETNRYNPS